MIALFQRLAYFDRERVVYERLAELGVHVVIGFTDGHQHDVPAPLHTVVIDPSEPLADEWTVVALGPGAGAFLVATDQRKFDPSERSLEASRQFSGRWGYARTQTGVELARLRLALGSRLDPRLLTTIDELLTTSMPAGGRSAGSGGTPSEMWATTSLYHMVDRMQTARAGTRRMRDQLADAHAADAARSAAAIDPQSGLPTPDFLSRWSNAGGATTLPIGLGLFDIGGMATPAVRDDPRAAYHAAHRVAAALTQPLGPVDAAVRLSECHFLVVLPGASARHLARVCDEIGEQLRLASRGYPEVSLAGQVATVVTPSRPLPLTDLHLALDRTRPAGGDPWFAGTTANGDRIVMAPAGAAAVVEADPPAELEQPA
jgi:hypothetical protein